MTFDHQQAESQAADAAQVLQEACDKKIDEDDLAGLRSLLQQWKDPTNIASKPTTDDFESLLVGAIKGHKLDILEFLLDNGAELTSLVMQMCAGHASLQAFRLFMQHGWQPPGDPPIPLSVVLHSPAITTLFLTSSTSPSALINTPSPSRPYLLPLEAGCLSPSTPIESIALLLDNGATVSGTRALHAATTTGHIDIMALLLAHNIDINAIADDIPRRNEAGGKPGEKWGTALHVAAKNAQEQAFEWLVGRGADLERRNWRGLTAREEGELWVQGPRGPREKEVER